MRSIVQRAIDAAAYLVTTRIMHAATYGTPSSKNPKQQPPQSRFNPVQYIPASVRKLADDLLAEAMTLAGTWGARAGAAKVALSPYAVHALTMSLAAVILWRVFRVKKEKAISYIESQFKTVTPAHRDRQGVLLIGTGDFPFPRTLKYALEHGEPLTEDAVDVKIGATHPTDPLMFKFLYLPVDQRTTLSKPLRKKYAADVERMGYTDAATRHVILRRVSEYDILKRPDVVAAAARTPGMTITKAWAKTYATMRGIPA